MVVAAAHAIHFPMLNLQSLGSPRSRPARETTADAFAVDIYKFLHEGRLPAGVDRVVLRINETIEVPIGILWEAVNYGGARPWWTCPRCLSRRRFLRVRGDQIACAPCLDLEYHSRWLRWKLARSLRRAARLRSSIGASPLPFSALPPRPRRQPVREYDRIAREIEMLEREMVARKKP
jgi:hypothetical protein